MSTATLAASTVPAAPTPAAPTAVPAGWYADPAGTPGLRWWSGAAWTEHTAPVDVAAPSVDAVVAKAAEAASPPALTRRQLREQESRGNVEAPAPAVRVPVTDAGSTRTAMTASFALRDETGFVELATPPSRVTVFTPLSPTRVQTLALWMIALLPLGWAVASYAMPLVVGSTDRMVLHGGVAASVVVLTLFFAARDVHLLRLGGHSDTASPWWVLLSPLAYLIVRAHRVQQETGVRSPAAAWAWILSTLPVVAVLVGARAIDDLIAAL